MRPPGVVYRRAFRPLLMVSQYVEHMVSYATGGKESLEGKHVAISGSGNVAQYAALKVIALGGIVRSLSDSKGCVIATTDSGITAAQIAAIAQLKLDRKALTEIVHTADFADKVKYIDGARPWTHVGKVDIALPCATQNEVSGEEAKALIEAGAKFIAEGSNMGCSQDAIDVFEESRKTKKGQAIWYGPGQFILQPQIRSTALITHSHRQSLECRWRGRLCPRDGTEFAAHVLDDRGG
jgi:glutamate dehydrogenase (NADP+)